MTALQVGILGAGRLGQALSLELRDRAWVTMSDVNVKKAKQFCKQNGVTFLYEEEQWLQSDYLLLCIPADGVRKLLQRARARGGPQPVFVNMATALDTTTLIDELHISSLRVLGLKLIGQFTALRYRLPVLFVTSSPPSDELDKVAELFQPIGNVVRGDEGLVSAINRCATRHALRLGKHLTEALQGLSQDASWACAAGQGVAAGTLLDYPPSADNAYTAQLMASLDQAESVSATR